MICKTIFVAWSAALAASVAGAASASTSDGTKESLRGVMAGGDNADRKLQVTEIDLCIEVPSGEIVPGSRLVAGTCDDPMNGFEPDDVPGDIANLVKLHSRKNSTMCMHAEPLEEGTFVRLRTCRDSNTYQEFRTGRKLIRPVGDKTLCVAPHGATPEAGDFIKLKKCSTTEWTLY